jgi:hypothetical protein
LISSFQTNRQVSFILPAQHKPDAKLMSRFLAKVALEVLAFILWHSSQLLKSERDIESALDEVVNKPELDDLKNYARFDAKPNEWPFNMRSIYPEGKLFTEKNERFELLHEFDLLVTESNEYYLVVAIFGVEYVLNLGGREIEGYHEWLKRNDFVSPLYFDWRSLHKQN